MKLKWLTVWGHRTATVTMTLAMLCLVCVYLVVEKDGWAHSVNNVSLQGLSYQHIFGLPLLNEM
jgi:hypothetical protein